MSDVTKMPNRPMWPNIEHRVDTKNADPHALSTAHDNNRIRRFRDDAYLPIGIYFGFGPSGPITCRQIRRINPTFGAKYTTDARYINWTEFFIGDYFTKVINWVSPGAMNKGVLAEAKHPLIHFLRPHGMLAGQEPYNFYSAVDAADHGQPWLVEGFHQQLRHLRNCGIDSIIHTGCCDRNQQYNDYEGELRIRTLDMYKYSKAIVCQDNATRFEENGKASMVTKWFWDLGIGSAVEGVPSPDRPWWDKVPFTQVNWLKGFTDRLVNQTEHFASKYPEAGTDEFYNKYGEKLWVIVVKKNELRDLGANMPGENEKTEETVKVFLTRVAEHTRAVFNKMGTDKCVVCLADDIVALADDFGYTPDFFLPIPDPVIPLPEPPVFPTIPTYDDVTDLHDQLIYTEAVEAPVQEGLIHAPTGLISQYDWTGSAIAARWNEDPANDRHATSSCVLLGPSDQTRYAYVSNHVSPKKGGKVYWLNKDNVEITRNVVGTRVVNNAISLILLDEAIVSERDKIKIYPIAENPEVALGRDLICLEQDRRTTLRKISAVNTHISHTLLIPEGQLESGDSGKPAFVAVDGELICLIAGHWFASSSPSIRYHADDLDAITLDELGQVLTRVTLPS